MANNNNISKLFTFLKSKGQTNAKDVHEFATRVAGAGYRNNMYNNMRRQGADIGTVQDFNKYLGYTYSKNINKVHVPSYNKPQVPQNVSPYITGQPINSVQGAVNAQDNKINSALNEFDKKKGVGRLKQNVDKAYKAASIPSSKGYPVQTAAAQKYEQMSQPIQTDEQKYENYINKLQKENNIDKATAEQQYRSEMSKREGGGFVNSLMQMISKAANPFAYEEASLLYTEGGRKIMQADATDKQLSEARESIKEAKSENSGSNFVKNTAKGILKGAGDMSTWDFGLSDAHNSTALLKAVNAYSSNKANKQQKRLLEATALNNLVSQNFGEQIGMWYKAGKISGQSLGFMAQMIADPISGLGSGAGKAATKLFLKGLANKIGRAGVAKLFAKTAVKKLGIDIGKGALMATVGSGTIRTVADTQQRRAGNAQYDSNGNVQITNREDAGTALAKAIWNQTGQNGTEFMGEHFGRLGKMLGKSVAKGIAGNVGEQAFRIGGKELQGVTLGSARKALYDIALGKGFGKVGEAVSKLNAKAKYNSGIGEYGEEVAGNVWNLGNGDTTLDTDENTGIFNLHNNLQTFLGVSLFGGVESAMKTGAYCMPASWNARIDLKNIDKQNAKLFGEEGWKSIKSKLDVAADSPTKLNELYEDIEDEKETGFDVKQREAIANYMGAQQKAIGSRGITLAMRPTSVDIDNDKGKFTVTATGKFGNVLKKRTFDNEDEANAEKDSILVTRNMNDARNLYAEAGKTTDSEQQRIAEDLINSTEDSADDINKKGTNLYNSYINSVADANSKKQEQIEQFEEENGLERGGLEDILSKNPLKLTREEEDITSRATDFLRGMILPPGSLHAEESAADAQQAADKDGIGSDNVNAVSVQTRVMSWDDAQNAYNALPEDVQQQVAQMQKNGNSNEEILDFVSENFNDTEKVLPVIADMMNADAAKNAYMQTAEDNINKQVEDTAKKLTFVGTVNGEQRPDTLQIVTDKTGKQCAVASGNISAKKGSDLSEGNSVDVSSDSGVVILRDMETGNLIVSDGNDLTYNKEQPLEEFKQNAYEIQGQKTSDVIMPQTPEQQVVPSEPVQQGITVRDGDGNIHTPSDPVPTEGQIKVQNGNEPTKEEPTKQGTLVDKDGKHVGEMPSMKVDDTPTQSVEQEPIKQQAATQGNDTVDEDGNLIYDKAPVEDTLKDLRDGELSDNEVSDFIDANIAEAKSNFDKENKKAPKMSTNKKKYLAEKTAWKSIADEAKRKLDYWNSVKAANEEVVKQIAADKIAKEQAKQEPIKEQPIEQPKAEVKEEPKKAEEPIKEIPKEGTPKEEHIADTSKKIEPEEGNHLRDNTKKVKETLPVDKKEPTKDAVKEADKTRSEINEARKEVEKNPTEAQKEAGNYKKGHVNVDGYDITIENPKGSERSSKDKDGNEWSVKMNNDYGYIKGTEGVDGDHVDIFLSDFPNQGNVFVIDQVNPDGSFDEHKVMYGFDNMEDAKNAYLANYSKGWKGLGNISEVSKEEFKKWINSSTRKTKPFSEYKSVSTIGDVSKNGASIGNTAEDKADEYIKGRSNIAKRNSKEKTEFNDDYDTDYELSKLFGRVSNDYLEKMSKSENKVAREIALRELDLRKIENKFSQKFDEEFSKQEEIPETEAKSKKFNPYDYTEGDDKRPNFEGVYNDASGYGVVTDGHILLADKKLYDKKNKGKVIGKDGREIDGGKYPNWKSVIPHNRYYVDAVEKLSKKINSIESKMKANWKRAKDNNENPGSFAKYISNLNVCLKMPNGKVMVFRYDTLSKFINAAKELGTTKINFEFKDKSIVAKSKGGECIVMPVAYDSDAYSLLQMQSNHEGGILIDLSKEPSGENKIEKQADTTLDDLTNDTEAQKATTDTVVEALNNNKDVKVIVEDSNAVPDGAEKQIVFHGSGNKFDTFDFSHMGEGEGAQAYGWGGYVTEVEGIGKSYAKKMLSDKYSENRILNNLVRDGLKSNNGDKDKLLSYLESLMGENWSDKKRVRAEIRIIKRGKYLPEGTVSLYSVSIPDNTGNNYLGFTDIIGEDKANKIGIYLNKIGFSKTDSEIPTFENNGKRIIINPKAKGSDIYAELSEAFGTDKEASHILNEAGFIGIQYPAQYRSGGRSDDASNYVIFNEKDIKITNRVQFLKDSDGKVYGWAVGNEIHLTKDGLNPNTPIHEYTHLWAKAMMKANPKEWDNIKSILKGTPVWEEVLNDKNYQDIKDNEDDVASEVLSRISGRENSKRIIDDMQKAINKAKGEGKVLDVARKTKVLNNIKNAIQKFWNWVGKDLFNIQFKSIDEVTDRVLYDLVEGTELKLTNDNDARYQFIGEKGAANADKAEEATTRLDNLQVARDMENSKKDAKTIKMATGWERGADVRFRIDNSGTQYRADARRKIDEHISNIERKTGVKINRVANIGQTTGEVHDRIEKGDKVTGWYDQKTGEVNLYMPNINSVYEAERTVLHELSGHKGLREMFGTHYSEFMRSVWNNRNQELVDYVSAHLMENGGNLYKTIDEYLAEQAEKDATPIGFWAKICKLFTDVIHNIGYTFNPNINDVRFVIWQSNRFMRGKNSILDKARAIRMKQQLKDNPPVFVSINNRIYGDNISVGSNNLTKDQSDELDKVGLDSEYFSNYQNMENMSPEKFDEYTGEGLLYNDTPTTSFQKLHYESALKRISFVWKEAHVNSMQSAIELLKAITGKDVNDIDSNENFIWGENQMSSVGEAAGEKFVKNFLNPLSKIVGILAPSCGVDFKDGMSNLQLYMYKMSGLERNRVFFIRDFINSQKKLEDSDPNRKYTNDELDKLQSDWDDMKKKNDDELHDGKITVFDYFGNLDNFVCQNIDDKYIAGEHDYSALSQMEHGTGKSTYDDMAVIDDIANTESSFGVDFSDAHDKRNQLWDAVNNINNYCLTFSYECGLDSKDAHDHVAKMMRYYIPMRGFNDKEANDEYDYTLDDESSNRPYVGPAIMQAKGRNSSLADLNIMAMMAMMANTAIVRGLRNKMVAQRFARMVRNHHKDVKEKDRLVSEVLTWYAKKKVGVDANGNDIYEKGSNGKDVYYEQNPLAELEDNIKKSSTSDAEAEDKIAKLPSDRIAKAISDFNDRMEKEKNAGNAFTKKGKKPNIDIIKLTDKQKSEHIITAMFNGEKSQFILNGNPRASMAINGELGFQRTNNWFMKNVGAINRFMAQWQTSYSPNFIIRNTQRDGFFALSNITINETMKYRQKWEKNYAKCAYLLGTGVRSKSWTKGGIGGKNLLVAYQNDNLNENKFIEKCFKEFIDNGGRTGIVTAKSQEEWNSDMLKEAKKIIDGPIRKGGKEAVQAIPKLIEQLNSRAELLARFSTYLTSRETGRSIGRSISDAKEVSTNFNRSGAGSKSATFKQSGSEYGEHLASINAHLAGYTSQALREFINYYNAGMQSLGMMTKNFDKHSVKTTAVFSMAILGGLIIPALNAWLIGNDDKKKKKIKDDPYSELPEWTRRDNICIYKGDGEFYTIALPIELRAFYGMGDVAAGYTLNPKLISDISAGEQIVSLASSLLPVDFMGTHSNALAALIPSALSPIVDVATNTKWTKMPIQREANYMNKLDYMPLWMREYGDPTVTTDISKWVNGHTNGTPDHNPNYKGWGDIISPSQVNYLVQQYAGGAGKSVMDLSNLYKEQTDHTHKFTLGGLVGSKYLPMANTQHTTSDGYSEYARTNTRFYNYKDEFDKIDAFVRTAKKEPHGENIMDYLKAQNLINKPEGARYYIMRHYMKLYNKYNKLKNRSKGTSKEDLYKGRILNLKLDAVADLDKIKD